MINSNLKTQLNKLTKLVNSKIDQTHNRVFFKDGKMYGTNFEQWFIFDAPGTSGYGSFDLPTAKKILSKLDKHGEIKIIGTEDKVTFETKQGNFNFPSCDIDAMVEAPILTLTEKIVYDFMEIEKMEQAAKFVGKDDLRPVMTFIYFGNEKYNGIAATNAHKLYFSEIGQELPENTSLLISPLVPVLFKNNLIHIATGEDENNRLRLYITDNYGNVYIQDIQDNIYPNVRGVIPTENLVTMELTKKELLKKLGLAILAGNPYTHQIQFDLKDGKINLSSENTGSSYSTTLKGSYQEEITIGFNGKFLSDIVKECDDKIRVEYSTPNRSVIINGNYLIMPIMIK